jgi:hypothetical protein
MISEKLSNAFYVVSIVACLAVGFIGSGFVGVVIGESFGRSSVQQEEAKLIISYHETLASKDEQIAELSKTAVTAASVVVAEHSQVTTSSAAAKQSAASAKAAHRSVIAIVDQNIKVESQTQKKLKSLK